MDISFLLKKKVAYAYEIHFETLNSVDVLVTN